MTIVPAFSRSRQTPIYGEPAICAPFSLAGKASGIRFGIEEQWGRPDMARYYYREFLRRYDRPVIGHQAHVEAAMVRLEGTAD